MKVLKWFVFGFAGILLLLWAVSFFLPKSFYVEETTVIEAPAGVVFAAVSDLTLFTEWEPWGPTDETMEVTFGETTEGAGASYSWEGKTTGSGTLTILEAVPPRLVRYRMVFNGEEETPSLSEMQLTAVDGATTRVTWTFSGDISANPVHRYVGLLIAPMIGKSYQAGLVNLKALCEKTVAAETEGG